MLVRTRCHVQAPHAIAELAHLSDGVIVPALEPLDPVATCLRVVVAQVLDVPNFEARLFSFGDQLTQWQKIKVREDVAVDELAAAPEAIARPAHRLLERRAR